MLLVKLKCSFEIRDTLSIFIIYYLNYININVKGIEQFFSFYILKRL